MRFVLGWIVATLSLPLIACESSVAKPASAPVQPPSPPSSVAPVQKPSPPPATPSIPAAPENPSNCPASGAALIVATLHGQATYYSDKFQGRKTASGERYDAALLTAAHRTLAFGSLVRVTRTDNDHFVCVRITDRGPFGSRKRIIDLSKAAARRLDMLRAGVVPVKVEVLEAVR